MNDFGNFQNSGYCFMFSQMDKLLDGSLHKVGVVSLQIAAKNGL